MTKLPLIALLLTVVPAGCAAVNSGGTAPAQSTEALCKTSVNPSGCRIKHDLAGGPPMHLVQGR